MAYEPLSGIELGQCLERDAERLCEQMKSDILKKLQALFRVYSDLSTIYAYPRIKWEIRVKATPYYTDEKPIEAEASGDVGIPIKYEGEAVEMLYEQSQVNDPDALRPEMQQEPKIHEEASEKPQHLNPMVRFGS